MRISDWSSDVCSSDLLHLAVDVVVGLTEELAPLRVACDHVAHVELGQHGRGHLTGERALLLPVAVLRTQRDQDRPLLAPEVGLHRSSEARRVGKEWVSTCRSRW